MREGLVSEPLRRLLAFDPDALARLAEQKPSPNPGRVISVETQHGRVVTVHGRHLHSGRDPEREARRWARELAITEDTIVVLLGYGSGYAVRALRRRTAAPIVVFEPDLEVLRVGIEHGTVPSDVVILTRPELLAGYLNAKLLGRDQGTILAWAPSLRSNPPLYQSARQAAIEAIDRACIRFRTATLRGQAWLDHYLTNLPHAAAAPRFARLRGSMAGIPAIVVAAGPSLDRNIGRLRDLDDTALVLTVNTAARALERAGIRPHALVTIESADTTEGVASLSWMTEIPAFIELTGNPRMWTLPFASKIPISVDTNGCAKFSALLDPGLSLSGGFCVANTAVSIAHLLGCDPIVLVGSDLAYTEGRVYATGTMFDTMRAVGDEHGTVRLAGTEARRTIEARSTFALGNAKAPDTVTAIQVPAADGLGTVATSADFKLFRDWYTHAAKRMTSRLINATEGGALIPGWTHEPLACVFERHALGTRGDRESVTSRFSAVLQRPPLAAGRMRDVVQAERNAIAELQALVQAAREIVHDDPDGDIGLDGTQATRLTEINAQTRQVLQRAPLVEEACKAPIESLRQAGPITTFGLYASLTEPLQDLDERLARLLHMLGSAADAALLVEQAPP